MISVQRRWLKPYSKVEEGAYPGSIIGFQEFPYTRAADGHITSFIKHLYVDLWIVKTRLTWIKKMDDYEAEV